MRLAIDQSILDKNNLSIGEFLLLYVINKNINIEDCLQSIIDKGLANKDLFEKGKFIISDNIKNVLKDIIIDSDTKVLYKEKEFSELAQELRELYPKGKKEGTTYMWRGTTIEVANKLKTLKAKYGCEFTKEQAIEATKNYIQSFNGDYTKMRLLKYFILKCVKDADGNTVFSSDLMNIIENGGEPIEDTDWTTNMV